MVASSLGAMYKYVGITILYMHGVIYDAWTTLTLKHAIFLCAFIAAMWPTNQSKYGYVCVNRVYGGMIIIKKKFFKTINKVQKTSLS